ncbi:hypothetical protein [Dysosmobacter sp.]|jgi:hypothetical protein|uniref:hypothetical protein n=1 Tax=Dysosmobacter sp. TaxID=2591382 RepID=UPI003D8B3661
MRINHGDAIILESIVRKVFSCDRAGMGGYIDADHFETEPFDAALIALAPLWKSADAHDIEDFLYRWEKTLRSEDIVSPDIALYIKELDKFVSNLIKS